MTYDSDCKVCKKEVRKNDRSVECSKCKDWYHIQCVGISVLLFRGLSKDSIYWSCRKCKPLVDEFMNRNRKGDVGSEIKVDTVVSVEGKSEMCKDYGSWRKIAGCKPRQVRDAEPISLRNRFTSLPEESEVEDVLVYGDSIVRGIGIESVNKGSSRRRRFRVSCYPGQGVTRVSEGLSSIEEKPLVVSVGGNDIGSVGSEELKRRFRDMLDRLRDRRSTSVVMGILPRRFESREWSSRAIALNRWLDRQCLNLGFNFIDSWSYFINRPDRFARDGIHLSPLGREAFIDLVDRKIKAVGPVSSRKSVGCQTKN